MKYNVIRHLKTKSKSVGMFDKPSEAKQKLKELGAVWYETSYIGGFPLFNGDKGVYSVQGAVMTDIGTSIICSLHKEAVEYFKK